MIGIVGDAWFWLFAIVATAVSLCVAAQRFLRRAWPRALLLGATDGLCAAYAGKGDRRGPKPPARYGPHQPARTQHYETFNQLLNVQQPYLFAFTPDTLLASPPTLRGLAAGTFSLHAGIHLWWLQE